MRLSLNLQIIAGITLAALSFFVLFGILWGAYLRDYLHDDAYFRLGKNATFMAERLEVGLWARAVELSLVGNRIQQLGPKGLSLGSEDIEHLQELVPQFAWVGLVDLEGHVVAATDNLLVGTNISDRPVFRGALKGHFTGDVHEAVLLDGLLRKEGEKPLRFVDLSMHLADQAGHPFGVLAAHLDWRWAESIEQTVLGTDAEAGIEIIIVNRDDTIVLASEGSLVGQKWAGQVEFNMEQQGFIEARDRDGIKSFLISPARVAERPRISELGWKIFARQPAEIAMAPVDHFVWGSAMWGSVLLLLCLTMALLLARQITRPIAVLTRSANAVAAGMAKSLRVPGGSAELKSLGMSIQTLLAGRDQLEERLIEQSELLRAILNAAVDSIITIDETGRIVAVNRSCERAFGYNESELVGRNVSILMPPPHKEAHDGYLARYLSTGEAKIIGIGREVPARRRDGAIFPAELSIGEVQLAGRRLFTGIIRDLTTNVILRNARDEAESASRAKSKFLSAASHDLRQPVHALGLLASALSKRATGDSLELVLHIQSVVKSMQGMFDSLLDIARLEAGTYKADLKEVHLNRLLHALMSELSPDAAEKNVRLKVIDTSVVVTADPVLLDRLLRNLVSNAIKFAPEGKILLGVRRSTGIARVVVTDSGVGIAADQLETVFEEFRQLPNGKAAGGLGLGLSISRSLARLMNSELRVSSSLGKGSVFWLDLPVVSSHNVEELTSTEGKGNDFPDLFGLKVLIADDDSFVLSAMQSEFSGAGAEILLASNSDQVVQHLRARPDLAVLDLQLDGEKNVIDLLDQLKSEGETLPPILFVTGATEAKAVSDLRGSGLPWLTKPVDPSSLREAIRRILRRRKN